MCRSPREHAGVDCPRRVAIVCTGSRGDCQPFVALALALQKHYIRVRFYAPAEMKDVCGTFFVDSTATGLPAVDFFPLQNLQIQTFLKEDKNAREAMSKGNFLTFMRAASSPKFLHLMVKDTRVMIDDMREVFQPDHIVYNTVAAIQGHTAAQLFDITSTNVSMQMMIEMSAIEPSFLISPETAARYPGLNKLMWRVQLCLFAWSPVSTHIQKHYTIPELGFKRWTGSQIVAIFQGLADGCAPIVARSPLLSPPPSDWSAEARQRVLGALVISADEQVKRWPPSPELRAFLSHHDDKPVYLGWGSMIAISAQHMLTLAVRTLMQLGRRGIILAGWAGLTTELLADCTDPDAAALRAYAEAKVLVLDKSAPHEWLFPRCDALVHHGGAGTTASAMRSGVPSVITPCFCDQPEVAAKVEKLGAGIALTQFHSVTAKQLAEGLRRALHDPEMRQRAREVGEALRAEDGATTAANDIACRLRDPKRVSWTSSDDAKSTGRGCFDVKPALNWLQEALAWKVSAVAVTRKSSVRARGSARQAMLGGI